MAWSKLSPPPELLIPFWGGSTRQKDCHLLYPKLLHRSSSGFCPWPFPTFDGLFCLFMSWAAWQVSLMMQPAAGIWATYLGVHTFCNLPPRQGVWSFQYRLFKDTSSTWLIKLYKAIFLAPTPWHLVVVCGTHIPHRLSREGSILHCLYGN